MQRLLVEIVKVGIGTAVAVGLYFLYCSLAGMEPDSSVWHSTMVVAFALLVSNFMRKPPP